MFLMAHAIGTKMVESKVDMYCSEIYGNTRLILDYTL